MAAIHIVLEGIEQAFADVPADRVGQSTLPLRIVGIPNGMTNGKPAVAIGIFLPNNGGCVIGQTSLEMFLTAADALRAKFGDPRT